MNKKVIANFSKLKPSLFVLPLCLMIAIVLYLYFQHDLSAGEYIEIQKNCFFFINAKLSQFPRTEYNLTQFGDALVFLSFLSVFILYAPKMWESLISASLISGIFSSFLKNIFAVPRPAMVFDNKSFVIIGKTINGVASLPSGHSITIFTTLTVLLLAFMPQKLKYKILWIISLFILALVLAFTRVGVGAHYPLDVIAGGIIGSISGLAGIFISQKIKIWNWINNKKYYPILIVLFLACIVVMINKIIDERLVVYYFALAGLVVSLYKITSVYVKK